MTYASEVRSISNLRNLRKAQGVCVLGRRILLAGSLSNLINVRAYQIIHVCLVLGCGILLAGFPFKSQKHTGFRVLRCGILLAGSFQILDISEILEKHKVVEFWGVEYTSLGSLADLRNDQQPMCLKLNNRNRSRKSRKRRPLTDAPIVCLLFCC